MRETAVLEPDPLEFVTRELSELRAKDLGRTERLVRSAHGARALVDGRRALMFCSNSYLGLHQHPAVVEAAAQAAREFGAGTGGSRLVCGTTPSHLELEAALAELKGTEDAVLFPTGYQANVGAVAALVGAGDLILSDRLNHASLIDACRQSRASVQVYPHGDAAAAAGILENERGHHRRSLIVTDGVFGMDGDLAPLRELASLAVKTGSILYVDDAHGTGVLGATGAGTLQHLGLPATAALQMGTLSKALGSEGGFIAGSRALCDFLRHRARSYVYSTSPAPAIVAAARTAIEVLQEEPGLAARLRQASARLRHALRGQGVAATDGITPIVPLHIGAARDAVRFSEALLERGFFSPAIRPPTVPDGGSRLRLTVTALHEDADIDTCAAAIADVARTTGVRPRAPPAS